MPNSSLSVDFVKRNLWPAVETGKHHRQGNLITTQPRPQQPVVKLLLKNKELNLLSEFDSS
jgi:hypothetical protein